MTERADTDGAAPRAVRSSAVMLLGLAAWVAADLWRTLDEVAAQTNARPEARPEADTVPGGLPIRLDPRVATAAELTLVPGIGPATAARIVEHRRRHGRSSLLAGDPDDGFRWTLEVVSGVGPVAARRAAPYLRHPADAAGAVR